ncbi:hypothetical protein SAMN02745136_03325 [Anaerocolumna jejuensis DSM 15929]|uniref:CopG family transcriptional regulator n=1 Tax=Anaerocolumna jejuensis DSM 15929 TaxID=1121322 RepID=A0A1M6V8U4_9FIRM|nr:hypothetical protein [Anaerocolumna jejuensis]SHK77868.1 hypothetical protein SAMN02745136_03325 [Anaerocolumna jejuensis DSM 15929]
MAHAGGRPQSDNPKQSVLGVRVTAEEHEKIKKYAAQHQQTISQVVLEGVELLFNNEKTQKET